MAVSGSRMVAARQLTSKDVIPTERSDEESACAVLRFCRKGEKRIPLYARDDDVVVSYLQRLYGRF
jgi:hypothetical protein